MMVISLHFAASCISLRAAQEQTATVSGLFRPGLFSLPNSASKHVEKDSVHIVRMRSSGRDRTNNLQGRYFRHIRISKTNVFVCMCEGKGHSYN